MAVETYQKQIDRKNIEKINEILKELPPYVKDYFNSRRINTTTRTRLVYVYDIRKFLIWIKENLSQLKNTKINEISLEQLETVTAQDIESFVAYLMMDKDNCNGESGVARKLSSIGSFFRYFVRHDLIKKNPCEIVDKPKLHNIEIIRLTPDEVVKILDTIEFGSQNFTKKQEAYLDKTRTRDATIFTVMLTTGIRVSELVGLNISDVNLNECKITIRRKGGNVATVFLSDEACESIKSYIEIRKKQEVEEENALFLSMQGRRISVQAVEDMVKKYAKAAGINKPITPHKLRKTYGTDLYKETGDIYLVASALGHVNVTTTTKHYAAQTENDLLNARNKIKLK